MSDERHELRAALDRLAGAEAERDKAIAERDHALATLKEAQFVNTQRKIRIRATNASQKARGEYRGGVAPFGWVYDAEKKLVPVPEQQEALRRIRKLAEAGLRRVVALIEAEAQAAESRADRAEARETERGEQFERARAEELTARLAAERRVQADEMARLHHQLDEARAREAELTARYVMPRSCVGRVASWLGSGPRGAGNDCLWRL
jgi:hypothetical protein